MITRRYKQGIGKLRKGKTLSGIPFIRFEWHCNRDVMLKFKWYPEQQWLTRINGINRHKKRIFGFDISRYLYDAISSQCAERWPRS